MKYSIRQLVKNIRALHGANKFHKWKTLVYLANDYYNRNASEIDRLCREESLASGRNENLIDIKIVFPSTQLSQMEN